MSFRIDATTAVCRSFPDPVQCKLSPPDLDRCVRGYRGRLRAPERRPLLKLRIALAPSLVALALVVPVSASAATLSVDKRCYGPGDAISFTGTGFTPNNQAALSVSGQQLGFATVNPIGEFEAKAGAPIIRAKRRTDVYTATDQANLALTASVPVQLSSLNVKVTPKNGDPSNQKKIVARGFTSGKVLWAHVKRSGKARNVKIGKLQGACKTITKKRKIFPANAATGVYSVQFDTKRKHSANTRPNITFLVTVFRTFRPASLSSTSWIQID
jgi:hypothetical protein